MSTAHHVIDICRKRAQRGYEASALRLLAEVESLGSPPERDSALARYQAALAVARECQMRPVIAQCLFGLGRLFAQMGNAAAADEHRNRALEAYRELEMRAPTA